MSVFYTSSPAFTPPKRHSHRPTSITFVNGRSRAEIATEMEQKLGLQAGEAASVSETTLYQVGSPEWSAELDRALKDIGLIAANRSKNM